MAGRPDREESLHGRYLGDVAKCSLSCAQRLLPSFRTCLPRARARSVKPGATASTPGARNGGSGQKGRATLGTSVGAHRDGLSPTSVERAKQRTSTMPTPAHQDRERAAGLPLRFASSAREHPRPIRFCHLHTDYFNRGERTQNKRPGGERDIWDNGTMRETTCVL